MPLHKKDFFGLRGMSADDIRYILGTAETMKYILNQKDKKTPHLQGKSVIMLFYEQSARAKLAYELAAQYLSANVIDMTNTVHSIEKESLQDIGQLMDQMGGFYYSASFHGGCAEAAGKLRGGFCHQCGGWL